MRRGWGRTAAALVAALAATAGFAAAAGPAAAQIRLRPDRSEFYFHGNLGPGAPSVTQLGITLEVWDWNAAGTDRTTRVISVSLPAGACVVRGDSCFYNSRSGSIRHFKMNTRSGKIWMQSFGDVSGAVNPKMTVDAHIGAETFEVTAVFHRVGTGWLLPDNDPQW